MNGVYITGIGQSISNLTSDTNYMTLAKNAVSLALVDAGLVKDDVQATFWAPLDDLSDSSCMDLPGSVVISADASASGSGLCQAMQQAADAIEKGGVDVVLVLETGMANSRKSVRAVTEQIITSCHENDVMVETMAARLPDNDCMIAKVANSETFGGRSPVEMSHANKSQHTTPLCPMLNDSASSLILCSERFLRKLKQPLPVQLLDSVSMPINQEAAVADEIIARLVNRVCDKVALESEGLCLDELVFSYGCSDRCLREIVNHQSLGAKGGSVNSSANVHGLHRIVDSVKCLRTNNSDHKGPEACIGMVITGATGTPGQSGSIGLHMLKRVSRA